MKDCKCRRSNEHKCIIFEFSLYLFDFNNYRKQGQAVDKQRRCTELLDF